MGDLVIIKMGKNRVSEIYISKKIEFAKSLGVKVRVIEATEKNIFEYIEKLNNDKNIRAVFLQLPIPSSVDRNKVLSAIKASKDVDGFHYILGLEDAKTIPPTILAIHEFLKFHNVDLEKGVLIVGGGFLVGKPLRKFLQSKNIEAEILQKNESHYAQKLLSADVSVVATGVGNIFNGDEFKVGATVIDASTVACEDRLGGDVEEPGSSKISLAPVPGGVGPVTVAMLFRNFFDL